MKFFLVFLILYSSIFAGEYDFDLDDIEVKDYEYSGYLKTEQKYQLLQDNTYQNNTFCEIQVLFKYFKDNYTLNSQFQVNHSNINKIEDNIYTTNQLFISYKQSQNHSFDIGKKTLKWGKGYFFNPIAFLDKKKDPNNPELAKEGYELINYKFNKSYNDNLKNHSFDFVYDKESRSYAMKNYFLYFDTDIDIVYLYNSKNKEKIGLDFSNNIETNFEVHAELVKEIDGYNSYLFGFKYLTQNELTITSEYLYQSQQLALNEAFYDTKYFINKFSLKEPFGIIYFSTYYQNSLNINDKSHQNKLGTIYKFKNNIELDISINKNIGDNISEFGRKIIKDTIYTQIIWYF